MTHSFTEPGEYVVNLAVIDNNGCVSLNLQPLQVLVSTIPLFNSLQSTPVCAGRPLRLSMAILCRVRDVDGAASPGGGR